MRPTIQPSRLALRGRMRRDLQLLGDTELSNDQLVNFDTPNSGAADGQAPDGYRTNGQRANSDGPEGQSAECSHPKRPSGGTT